MAQHDYVLANQSGSSFRTDLNNALAATVSLNSGSSAPSTTYAYQYWIDTSVTPAILKQRNAADNAWIEIRNADGSFAAVGIGTTSPTAGTLEIVDAAGDATAKLQTTNAGSSARLELVGDNTGTSEIRVGDQDDADVGRIIYDHTDDFLSFTVNAGEKARILSSGGITFNGDTAAANALDDYEEGTFTPVLRGEGTAGTYTAATLVGQYTKTGRSVSVTIRFTNITINSPGSGDINITALPFTAGSSTVGACSLDGINLDSDAKYVTARLSSGTTTVQLQQVRDNAGDVSIEVGAIGGGGTPDIEIQMTYDV